MKKRKQKQSIHPNHIAMMNRPKRKKWVSAMDKKDTRTEKETLVDFYENGFC